MERCFMNRLGKLLSRLWPCPAMRSNLWDTQSFGSADSEWRWPESAERQTPDAFDGFVSSGLSKSHNGKYGAIWEASYLPGQWRVLEYIGRGWMNWIHYSSCFFNFFFFIEYTNKVTEGRQGCVPGDPNMVANGDPTVKLESDECIDGLNLCILEIHRQTEVTSQITHLLVVPPLTRSGSLTQGNVEIYS